MTLGMEIDHTFVGMHVDMDWMTIMETSPIHQTKMFSSILS
jgi:hypothetical protein